MGWTTNDELEFLEGIGTQYKGILVNHHEEPKARRLRLLENYLRMMDEREWNCIHQYIDRDKVFEYVVREIAKLNRELVLSCHTE